MPFTTYTLANMRDMLQDRYESVAFWTTTEATNAINEALLMWNLLTGMWSDSITITTVANQVEYTLTSSIIFGTRVEFEGTPLTFSFLGDMDNGRPGWQSQTTADGGDVPDAVKTWIPLGLDKIMIWPADADGSNTLTVDGVAATPRLVNALDYIDIGNELINIIVGYAIHVLTLKEGGDRFAATLPYYFDFLTAAAEKNSQLKTLFTQYMNEDLNRQMFPSRALTKRIN